MNVGQERLGQAAELSQQPIGYLFRFGLYSKRSESPRPRLILLDLYMPGMQGIADDPSLLVRLSQLFGREVENYHETLAASTSVHEDVPEIFIVSNLPPVAGVAVAMPRRDRAARLSGSCASAFRQALRAPAASP